MKTKRVIVGAMTAAMLSLSVCSLAPVMAADETVQISVGTVTADPGASFSVEVSMADIPATGMQGCEFSIEYDNSLISVESVSIGSLADTGADKEDESSSLIPVFDSIINNDEGVLNLAWSTLAGSSYWLNGEGVFCTINGKVSSSASKGTKSDLKVVATKHETHPGSGVVNTTIKAGYVGSDEKAVNYTVQTKDGAVNIGKASATLKGDANCNGTVEVADAVYILQSIANPDEKLSDTGKLNADVDGNGVDAEDALKIQQYLAEIIDSL